jgi:hypothetical protein
MLYKETCQHKANQTKMLSIRTVTSTCVVLFMVMLSGCLSTGSDQILRASESPAPIWRNQVPEPSNGFVYFVGLSSGNATERSAREQARQDVIQQALEYLGGYAKRDFQERAVSMHLDSSILDPTIAARDFVAYANENFVDKVRTDKVYWELRRTPGGDQYFVYVLIPIPVNQSLGKFADEKIADTQRRVQEAKTEDAKKQAQNVLDFWQQTQSIFESK